MTRAHRIPTKRSSAPRWAAAIIVLFVVACVLAVVTV